MNIYEFVESKYEEIKKKYDGKCKDYIDLYDGISAPKLKVIFTILHSELMKSFNIMNDRLPAIAGGNNHFLAKDSRNLIKIIDFIEELKHESIGTEYEFHIHEDYQEQMLKCVNFLQGTGGSELPIGMKKIKLTKTKPIFIIKKSINVKRFGNHKFFELKPIGEGSYAKVFKFKDDFYNKTFALKRAKEELSDEELKRFEKEYEIMEKLNSLYITEVFRYDQDKNEYIMEYLDYDLEKYLKKFNSTIKFNSRKNIGNQVLNAFIYIDSQGYLHRDISPNNILLKKFDDGLIVKISDFGLVKEPQSVLTKTSTELKGRFNDPSLATEGFKNYEEVHEIYALTKLLYFILTGKVDLVINEIKNQKLREFVEKGMNDDKTKRFQSVEKVKEEFSLIEE